MAFHYTVVMGGRKISVSAIKRYTQSMIQPASIVWKGVTLATPLQWKFTPFLQLIPRGSYPFSRWNTILTGIGILESHWWIIDQRARSMFHDGNPFHSEYDSSECRDAKWQRVKMDALLQTMFTGLCGGLVESTRELCRLGQDYWEMLVNAGNFGHYRHDKIDLQDFDSFTSRLYWLEDESALSNGSVHCVLDAFTQDFWVSVPGMWSGMSQTCSGFARRRHWRGHSRVGAHNFSFDHSIWAQVQFSGWTVHAIRDWKLGKDSCFWV